MASIHEGRINKVMPGRFGPSFFVTGLDGFCNKGKKYKGKLPELEKGQTVKFEYETVNGKNYVSRLKVVESAPPASEQKGGSAYQDGQAWGGAVGRAVETATLIIANGGLKLGAANNPDARKTQIIGLIDQLTAKFYTDSTKRGPLKAQAAVDAEMDGGEETGEEDESPPGEASDDGEAWDDDIPL